MKKMIGFVPLLEHEITLSLKGGIPHIFEFLVEIEDVILENVATMRNYECVVLSCKLEKLYPGIEILNMEHFIDCTELIGDEEINLSVYYGMAGFPPESKDLKAYKRLTIDDSFMNMLTQGSREALGFMKSVLSNKF